MGRNRPRRELGGRFCRLWRARDDCVLDHRLRDRARDATEETQCTNKLVDDPQARILQAFRNVQTIAASEGASLKDCVRLTIYLSDLSRFAPMVEKAQAELWGVPPYPPRTMIEVKRLIDNDIAEIDSVFYAPK
jgi:enamine deaminase RidA (YjgF/YER057c/UK114 family)